MFCLKASSKLATADCTASCDDGFVGAGRTGPRGGQAPFTAARATGRMPAKARYGDSIIAIMESVKKIIEL